MKTLYFVLLIPFFPCVLLSQGIDNIWITGYDNPTTPPWGNTVINFSSGSPILSAQNRSLNFLRTNASICDTSGNLLFYTNGFAVCNVYGDTMPNGDSLDYNGSIFQWYEYGMPTPQAALIIKHPDSSNLYYLFHEAWEYFIASNGQSVLAPKRLFYSIIDMNADSGKGDIIIKEQIAINDTLTTGRMTAVKHANGRDWWIIKYEPYGDGYYALLLTPNGLSTPYYQQIGPYLQFNSLGQAVFNPQGNKYANVDGINHLLIMDFDRCSGLFSNPVYIPILDSLHPRGAAFSPSGRYLYITSQSFVYQYDMYAANIDSSRLTVAVWDTFYSPSPPAAATFYTMQLAPDGKIYFVAPNGVQVMHVINYPDSGGLACDVCLHCIQLPTFNAFTIPNHPNYFLGAEIGSICDSITVITENNYPPKQALIKIYPNPAKDFFWLDYDLTNTTLNGELMVYNTPGEIVLRKTLYNYFKSAKVECGSLPEGIYYLAIKQNGKLAGSGKLVKQ